MITNYFIPPHPLLGAFVDDYILSTSEGQKITLKGSWCASNETSLIFYMGDQPSHHNSEGALSALKHEQGCVVGLLSHANGVVSFSGVYHTFMIQFKANGFYKLFRLPLAEFVNQIFYLDVVFGKVAGNLKDELQAAKDIQQMAVLADKFLLRFLSTQKAYINLYDGITFVSNELFSKAPMLSIEQYAGKANMSVRNFGRRFTEQVGVSPKFYCRLLRFNKAINAKLKKPETSWSSIAHACGYFDQMHMIKDFKEFANLNPSVVFESNTEITRPHIELAACDKDASPYADPEIISERFVVVKRTGF